MPIVVHTGKIVHVATFFSDGQHGDTQIYNALFNDTYFEKCCANPQWEGCVWTESQLKEIQWLRTIWGKNGITLNDNGYHTRKDMRLKRPKEVVDSNAPRCSALYNYIKRRVTCGRHVVEQVNAHIKRWKILGIGRTLSILEVEYLPSYVKIAAGKFCFRSKRQIVNNSHF